MSKFREFAVQHHLSSCVMALTFLYLSAHFAHTAPVFLAALQVVA